MLSGSSCVPPSQALVCYLKYRPEEFIENCLLSSCPSVRVATLSVQDGETLKMKPLISLSSHVMLLSLWIFLIVSVIQDSAEIQDVRLILPPIVQAGTSATLLCLYDLQGASLYSVQWYRGQFEFFRYLPAESPPAKVFPLPGLYVDILESNERQVTLRNIPVQISGEFSCEVTTEAPPFRASCISENLTVIHFNLELNVPKNTYGFGELLAADCNVTPRLDSVKLMFHWNSRPVQKKFITKTSESVFLLLNTSILNPNKYFTITGELKCLAVIKETNYLLSKSVLIKLEPKLALQSSGTTIKFHLYDIVPLIVNFIIIK